jgi:hypothetical protein
MWHRLLQRHLHTHVYCSAIHNSQVMETTKMPHYWWTEFYSAMKKNEILLFSSKWMELGKIILSEVSQSQNDQNLYVLPHMQVLDLGQMQQCCWTWVTC